MEQQEITKEEKALGKGVSFDRIRRITGYLCKTNRANNAKYQEISQRHIHGRIDREKVYDS